MTKTSDELTDPEILCRLHLFTFPQNRSQLHFSPKHCPLFFFYFLLFFSTADTTTTRNSPTKSVLVQPSKHPQQLASRDNDSWLKKKKTSENSNEDKNSINFVSHSGDKMVAKQETELDESLKYGPGFVSKLKSKYLSLTLRQTAVKQRPSLAQLRRSTSLNNLLDEENDDEKLDENSENVEETETERKIEEAPLPAGGDGQMMMRVSRSIDKSLNLKRARSVEAILRYDNTAWERDVKEITIEDKIQSARERPVGNPPKRLISLIEDDERPPAGICKQTMQIFEASANRKRNLVTRPISTEIANKVAMFKGEKKVNGEKLNGKIMTSPPLDKFVSSPSPPAIKTITSPSPDKFTKSPSPLNTPALKPVISPRKPITLNNVNNAKNLAKQEKAILPKLDIKIIKNNLETKSNGSWSPSPVTSTEAYRNYSSPDTSLASSPNILSPFRNSMSPQQPQIDTSPVITSLSSKLNNLHMETSTPKAWNIKNNLLTSESDKESAIRCSVEAPVMGVSEEVKKVTTMSFSPKINNSSGSNGTKMTEEVKKPTTAPPPPPPYSVAVKQQLHDKDKVQSESVTSESAPKWTTTGGGKKKSWAKSSDDAASNTIVFNFSDRKDVPDYIDNDGLIMRRKRELPKVSCVGSAQGKLCKKNRAKKC